MKRLLTIALLFAFLTACQMGDEYVTNVNVDVYTQDYKVRSNQWQTGRDDESGIYYYCEFREPKLTQEVFDWGVMQAFLWINGKLTPLPFDDFWMNERDGYRWTEQVTCEFQPGLVTFILKYNDHATIAPYYDYEFHVRFMR